MTLSYRTLYILVEGSDDEIFFASVISPILANSYDSVQFWQYSQKTKSRVNKFIEGIKAMQAAGIADLIIVSDLDESPCVTDKKERILSRFRSLSADAGGPPGTRIGTKIQIVCKEIEGWYLAGV